MQSNKNRKISRRNNFSSKTESIKDILPSSEILEKFEDAVPESVSQLIEMARKEQNHRHNWQDSYLKAHHALTRAGQIFGIIYNLVLLALVFNLIKTGEKELALRIFLINAALIAFIALITTFERRVFSRRPRNNRGRGNPRFNSKKQQ